jgi:hypothetical protein
MFTKAMFTNSILFNVAWLGCVLIGDKFSFFVLTWCIFHLLYSHCVKSELSLIAFVTLLGVSIDTGLMHIGVFEFEGHTNIIPFWLIMIWVSFAMTLNGYLQPLYKSILLQCLVGAIFPPLSYLAGASFGAVSFSYTSIQTVLVISALWAVLLPLFFSFNHFFNGVNSHENTNVSR